MRSRRGVAAAVFIRFAGLDGGRGAPLGPTLEIGAAFFAAAREFSLHGFADFVAFEHFMFQQRFRQAGKLLLVRFEQVGRVELSVLDESGETARVEFQVDAGG